MTSQRGKQTIAILKFPILRSKDNKMMKFGQLIDYTMRKIFIEKSYTKQGGEIIPRHRSKKSKMSISKVLHSFIYCIPR